jgi:hypothetical protein
LQNNGQFSSTLKSNSVVNLTFHTLSMNWVLHRGLNLYKIALNRLHQKNMTR